MNVKGAAWLLGILLVVGMFAGVRFVLDGSANPNAGDKGAGQGDQPPKMVVCWGYFDVEPGVNRGLYPKQFGDVIKVVDEGAKVKEGVVLLEVNDAMARLKVKEAELAVKVAKLQLEEANKLPKLYDAQKEQQKAAIAAVDYEIKELEKDREKMLKTYKDEPILATIQEKYGFGLAKLQEKKKAENARLKQIDQLDADLKIKQAEADLEAKNLLVEQATEALKHYLVVAPSDGYVLRVNVKKREALGPNPLQPALEFRPDLPIIVRAEILQEWGRFIHDPKQGKEGQLVDIEDDVFHGPVWKGKVKKLSEWYAQTRTPVIEPFRYNDVRTMECIIELTDTKGAPAPRIGQRVRAKIKL